MAFFIFDRIKKGRFLLMVVFANKFWSTPCHFGNVVYRYWVEHCNDNEECVYDTITGELHIYDVNSEELLRKNTIPFSNLERYGNAF